MAISADFLELLVCPQCKGDLRLTQAEDGLVCEPCGLVYEIQDDIPVMLPEEARPLKSGE